LDQFRIMSLGRSLIRGKAALGALLIFSACAALPFFKPDVNVAPATSLPSTGPVAKLVAPSIAIDADHANSSSAASTTPASWHQPTPIVLPLDGEELPMLPQAPVARLKPRASASHIQEPDFSTPAPQTRPAKTRSPARKHRIVDGDSLPLLALRYLGDRSRVDEICQLNRNIITDPNLLPVGREILIPSGP
jgi:nucleoid-associated protein YgaU